jgi:hypothetical protein
MMTRSRDCDTVLPRQSCRGGTMNPIPVSALVLATMATLTAPPASSQTSYPATSPTATITRLAEAYDARSVPRMDALLTADYRFHFSRSDLSGSAWANGLSREFDMRSTTNLFALNPVETGNPDSPRLDSLYVLVGAVEAGVDPEHPDSSCQYRVAIAHDFRLRLVFTDGRATMLTPSLHVFHVVRGDAAVCMPGQPADTSHWYIRRWIEDVDAITIALSRMDGECTGGAEESQPVAIAPGIVGLRAIGAPLCPTLKVLCDLPGSEPAVLEVYDVLGRRLARRVVTPQSPGSVLVEAGSGRHFTPGAYWVRLTQGRRPPVTRPVTVAQ